MFALWRVDVGRLDLLVGYARKDWPMLEGLKKRGLNSSGFDSHRFTIQRDTAKVPRQPGKESFFQVTDTVLAFSSFAFT